MNIGQVFKKLRKEKFKLSGSEMAKKLGISNVHLSNIENNRRGTNFKLLEKMSELLGIPVQVIFWFSIDEDQLPSSILVEKQNIDAMIDIWTDKMINT